MSALRGGTGSNWGRARLLLLTLTERGASQRRSPDGHGENEVLHMRNGLQEQRAGPDG